MQEIQQNGTDQSNRADESSPFAPQTPQEVDAMLSAIGADSVSELFDVPDAVAFDDDFDIEAKSEREVVTEIRDLLGRNTDQTEFLGRGHYDHYVPSVVDYLSLRSEFLTSYTQYQPETSQGFLQALFEFQSMIVELTGLDVANCSMYDVASALGEVALLAARVRETSGSRILIPETVRSERRSVVENYADGAALTVETYPLADGNADLDALSELVDEDVAMVYAESPTSRGAIEERLSEIASLADDHEAAFCLGSDPVALALLEEPAAAGADIVIGDASVLGLPASHGMGLGLFAVKEGYLRQAPGRLVGASETDDGRRAYTLTLPGAAHPGGTGHVEHLYEPGVGRAPDRDPHRHARRDGAGVARQGVPDAGVRDRRSIRWDRRRLGAGRRPPPLPRVRRPHGASRRRGRLRVG